MQYPEKGFGYPWIEHRGKACLEPYHGGEKRHDDTEAHRDMTEIHVIVGLYLKRTRRVKCADCTAVPLYY